ncbi:MAG: DUF4038 domain-containing protein [Bryobacterales bacterium]|nr:DUF4038 domain-containing protein [Bryobacterales bacterium]
MMTIRWAPLALLSLAAARGGQNEVPQWTRFEARFTSANHYVNPLQEINLEVEWTGPGGTRNVTGGFWDGGNTWKARFSPDQPGDWSYITRSTPEDSGLNGQKGAFRCVRYTGSNPLYRRGAVGVSADRRHFRQADGTPWFWLSDTAWNGVMKADAGNWEVYLKDRVVKGFTAIQFISTNYVAASGNADLRLAYTGKERIAVDPVFYEWMDERIDAINDHGMIAIPALIWTWISPMNPGIGLPDDQIILLARYMTARWGSHQVIWLLNGDGDYAGEKSERWKRIGRAVFGPPAHPGRIAGLHPMGRTWMIDWFLGEPWFSFNGYYSGHRGDPASLRWLTEGPVSQYWKRDPHYPDVNLEPNYEGINDRSPGATHVFNDHDVRRAAYWSLLVAPPAGVSYGAHGVWSWELKPHVPMAHPDTGMAPSWREAMNLPGSTQMKYLVKLFTSLEWWRLRPAPNQILDQPGQTDPARFVPLAVADDGSFSLAYLPVGVTVKIKSKLSGRARWFNPRNGEWSGERTFSHGTTEFAAPDSSDWVLWRAFTVSR